MKSRWAALAGMALIAPIIFAACAPRKDYYVSPRLESRTRPVRSVVVLPGRVELRCEKVGDDYDCKGMETDVARAFEDALGEALALHGFVLAAPLNFGEPDRDGLYYYLTDMTLAAPEDRDGLNSLGPESSRLAYDAGADGLALIVARGEVHSAGQRTLALTADILITTLSSIACIFSPYPFCVAGSTNFFGDTQNYLTWRAVVADGADGEVLIKLWGRVGLDDFVLLGAPGQDKYPERIAELRDKLTEDINDRLDKALYGEE